MRNIRTIYYGDWKFLGAENELHHSFGASSWSPIWAVVVGNAAFAAAVPLGPDFVRRWGLKATYVTSTIVAAVGSLGAAIAWGPAPLMVGRGLQGAAAGVILMGLIPQLIQGFPAARRHRVLAVLVAGLFGSVALGPLFSTVALMHDQWRWIFLFSAGAAAMGSVWGATALPRGFARQHRSTVPLDGVGLTLWILVCGSFAVAMGQVATHMNWGPAVQPWIGGTVVAATASLAWESSIPSPLLPWRLLKAWKPALGALVALLGTVVLVFSLAMTIEVLRTANRVPDHTLAWLLLGVLGGAGVAAFLAQLLHDRTSAGFLAFIGAVAIVVADGIWAWSPPQSAGVAASGLFALLGSGVGLTVAGGLVGAALGGGSVSQLPRTMTVVQSFRLLFFLAVAPVFTWVTARVSISSLQRALHASPGIRAKLTTGHPIPVLARQIAYRNTAHTLFLASLSLAAVMIFLALAMLSHGPGPRLRDLGHD